MARITGVSLIALLFLASTAIHSTHAKSWGLLVSSANTWYNYGMQADVLHAYQIMKEGAIPDEQIVLMMYDDIAENEVNPFKGQVFQSYDLKDVYKGAPKDYTGDAVNKKTFMAVLRGDKEAVKTLTGRDGGKVIDSGPDDNVFVFISDHGGPGIVGWWDGDDMTAKELNETIQSMHENKRYKNMIFYIDTCFSGSMFENILPDNIGVYGASAANATQYSWSVDCESEYFQGDAETCLGGLFSINWVYEAQSVDRTIGTMDMQFRQAAIACEGRSNPRQYGDLSIAQKMEEEFFGNSAHKPERQLLKSGRARSSMPKHMMAYHHLENRLSKLAANSEEYSQVSDRLTRLETQMGQADQLMNEIPTRVYGRFQAARATREFGVINWSCYEPVLEAMRAECPGLTRREDVRYYGMSQYGVLINLCNDAPTYKVLAAVRESARASPLCSLD